MTSSTPPKSQFSKVNTGPKEGTELRADDTEQPESNANIETSVVLSEDNVEREKTSTDPHAGISTVGTRESQLQPAELIRPMPVSQTDDAVVAVRPLPVAFAVDDGDVRLAEDDASEDRHSDQENVPEYTGELIHEGTLVKPYLTIKRLLGLLVCMITIVIPVSIVTPLLVFAKKGRNPLNPSDNSTKWVQISSDTYGSVHSWFAHMSKNGDRFVVNGLPMAIYSWIPNESRWSLTSEILAATSIIHVSLSPDGTKLIAGNHVEQNGSAVVFQQNSTNQWVQLGDILYGDAIGDRFGKAPTITDGLTIAVGTGWRGGDYVKIFKWSNKNEWSLQHKLDGVTGSNFGHSLSMSSNGTKIIVGAPSEFHFARHFAGAAHIYDLSTSNPILIQTIRGRGKFHYAGSVSMSDDGSCVAVGSPAYASPVGHDGKGRVEIYRYSSLLRIYARVGKLISYDAFYTQIDLSGDGRHAAIGYGYEKEGSLRAYVDVYSISETSIGSSKQLVSEKALDAYAVNGTMSSVSISGDGTRVLHSTVTQNIDQEYETLVRVFESKDY